MEVHKHKKANMSILISNKLGTKTKSITNNKGHFTMIQGPIH